MMNNQETRKLYCYFDQIPPHFITEKGQSAVILSCENANQAKNLLGQEFELILFDGRTAFNLDNLAIAAGTLRAGGSLILWLNPQTVESKNDIDLDSLRWCGEVQGIATPYFYQHFYALLECYFPSYLNDFSVMESGSLTSIGTEKFRPTEEQQDIMRQMLASEAEIFILTAKRGRGKSALAGLFAQQLRQISPQTRIWLTAPNKSAVKILQEFTDLPLNFIAPDELCRKISENSAEFVADWLFIDEAAMIPLPMLFELISPFKRVLCSTTIHSYEGTGRGFLLKFLPNLHRTFQQFELHKPLRWAENDPLEQFIDALLLLEAEEQLPQPAYNDKSAVQIQRVSQPELVPQIEQFYGLLTLAHYRTSPVDLRRLFDAPRQQFYLAKSENQLIGGVWALEEGDLGDPELIEQICSGSRRPKGNLVAQKLAHSYHFPEFLTASSLRISRIALLEQWQQKGIGSDLIKAMAEKSEADFLSVSFGYTTELAKFWQKCGFILLHIGEKQEASSGCYSAIALLPLNAISQKWVKIARIHFERHFSLSDHSLQSELDFVRQWDLDSNDLIYLQNFIENHRTLYLTMPSIRRLLKKLMINEQDFFEQIWTIKEKKVQLNQIRLQIKSLLQKIQPFFNILNQTNNKGIMMTEQTKEQSLWRKALDKYSQFCDELGVNQGACRGCVPTVKFDPEKEETVKERTKNEP